MHVLRSKKRIIHLNDLATINLAESDEFCRWSKVRLARIVDDYLLRRGYIQTAQKLAKEDDIQVNCFDVGSSGY